MSTSIGAFRSAGTVRNKTSRTAASINLFGGAAIGTVVLGSAWTVYVNILAADVYPSVAVADFDATVVRRPAPIARSVSASSSSVTNNMMTAVPKAAPIISAPASIPSGLSISFEQRFAAAARQSVDPAPLQAENSKLVEAPKVTQPASSPRPAKVAAIALIPRATDINPAAPKTAGTTIGELARRAKAAVMSVASIDKPSFSEKLWGKPEAKPSLLSFASADANVTGSLGSTQNLALAGSQPRYERDTAVYDISARIVYLPDGTKLEAHSGLGSKLDDPRSANIRMHGVTPPHVYELKPREALFHGVPALRLTPVGGEEAIFGRSGLLAHSYMLGPNGDSNGCVSFKDYNAFLNAYHNQGIKRLAVVTSID